MLISSVLYKNDRLASDLAELVKQNYTVFHSRLVICEIVILFTYFIKSEPFIQTDPPCF